MASSSANSALRTAQHLFASSFLVLLASQSGAGTTMSKHERTPVLGSWGGRHVGLIAGPIGAKLEYDCANGEIEGPIRLDRRGRFVAAGYHIPGHGGPERLGDVPPRWRADYFGSIHARIMTLLVKIPSKGIEIGPFTLRRGAAPMIVRCL